MYKTLISSHLKSHSISLSEYKTKYPGAELQSLEDKRVRSEAAKKSTTPKWNKGLTKDTDSRVLALASKNTGRKHTEESKKKIAQASKEHWQDIEYRTKVIERATIGIRESYASGKRKFVINKDTIPELKVEECLQRLNIQYTKQYPLYYSYPYTTRRVKFYDFYLPDYKKIIEVQGDYWHAKKYKDGNITWDELNEVQQQAVVNDHKKFKIALDNSLEVFYIWEEQTKQITDIYEEINRILRTNYKLV
jgi:G:T-mismatch repair DNA endonuclease (very short patch repair protein)